MLLLSSFFTDEEIEAKREQQVQNSTVSRRNSIWTPDYITLKAVLLTMFLDHFPLGRLRCDLCSGPHRLSIHRTPVLYNQQGVNPKTSELLPHLAQPNFSTSSQPLLPSSFMSPWSTFTDITYLGSASTDTSYMLIKLNQTISLPSSIEN